MKKSHMGGMRKAGGERSRPVNVENSHPAAGSTRGVPMGRYVGANVRGSKAKTFSRGK